MTRPLDGSSQSIVVKWERRKGQGQKNHGDIVEEISLPADEGSHEIDGIA